MNTMKQFAILVCGIFSILISVFLAGCGTQTINDAFFPEPNESTTKYIPLLPSQINTPMPTASAAEVHSTSAVANNHSSITVPAGLQETLTKAQAGDAQAQLELGLAYVTGKAVDKDYAQAVNWFRKAAEQGNDPAQAELGMSYLYGQGVDKNYGEAIKWFQKASSQRNSNAENYLGLMYQNGWGVSKDNVEAIKWYSTSAEQGNQFAEVNFGFMYQNGWGVEKNVVEAKQWFQKAADQGNDSAKLALQQLNNGQ